MTNSDIQRIIDAFNLPVDEICLISKPIGANVYFGLVWDKKDYRNLSGNSPYKFYFICDIVGQCIGAVYDMSSDLHWYISPTARKKGYLTTALLSVILPHLSKSKRKQRVTINLSEIGEENFQASLRSANLAGFRFKDHSGEKMEGIQSLAKFKNVQLKVVEEGMSIERIDDLRREMNSIAAGLWKIQSELEFKLGVSKYSLQLSRTVKELNKYTGSKLDNALWEFDEIQALKNSYKKKLNTKRGDPSSFSNS